MKSEIKEYLVTLNNYGGMFIVSAKNAKDAIAQVWEEHFLLINEGLREDNKRMGYHANHIYAKSELTARSLGSLHNEQGKIIYL